MTQPACLGISLALLSSALSAAAATPVRLYVDRAAPPGGDGSSWVKAFQDLHSALDKMRSGIVTPSNPNCEIRVAQGTYTPGRGSFPKFSSYRLDMGGVSSGITLSLLGSFGGLRGGDPDRQDYVSTPTILSGDLNGNDLPNFGNRSDNIYSIAYYAGSEPGDLTVDGFIFRAANSTVHAGLYSPEAGSALRIIARSYSKSVSKSVTVSHCAFEENQSLDMRGTGLYLLADKFLVTDCRFTNNRSSEGGGAGLAILTVQPPGYQTGTVQFCEFSGNAARVGGGAWVDGPQQVSQCTFADNWADFYGGAIFSGSAYILNSLLVSNHAGVAGGAVAADGTAGVWLRGATIVNNSAPQAGAIYAPMGPLDLRNSILWHNAETPGDKTVVLMPALVRSDFEGVLLEGGKAAIDYDVGLAKFSTTVINADPQFARPAPAGTAATDWRNWNYRLRPSSPAIKAGGYWQPYAVDLDGFHPANCASSCQFDLGAYYARADACLPNLNEDSVGVVNDADFLLFLQAYQIMLAPPADPNADFNRDGLVDDADFAIFAAAYAALICP